MFRDGRHVITTATSELTTADLIRHMVGRTVSLFPKVETAVGDVLLEVEGLTRAGEFEDIAFSVRAGEIVGMAGLVGAGRTEVARVLFGIDQRDAGEVRVAGKPVHFSSPSEAMSAGVAYLPEDRHQEGLVLDFSIAENVTLPILPRLFPRFLVRSSAERVGRPRVHGPVQRPDDGRRPAGRRAVGRQPAEGRAGQVAGVEADAS